MNWPDRYFTKVGRWGFRIVKEQIDGLELGLEEVAGLEFESHLSDTFLTLQTLARGNTMVSAILQVVPKPAVPASPRMGRNVNSQDPPQTH